MKVILFIAVLFSGLVAGLFYAYSCSVNPGLKMLSDANYLQSMQSINAAIQNPAFFISFMGLLVLLHVSAYQSYGQPSFPWILAAVFVYGIGVFGVTVFCNVPLNERLAEFSLSAATLEQMRNMRQLFETPWNFWHGIRTFASVLSFGLLIFSLFKRP